MERRFSLMEGRGQLTVREEHERIMCKGEMPDDKSGLYKGWIAGPEGRALLGTFLPEAGRLRLSRTMSRGELERQGAWPPLSAEAVLSYTFEKTRRERKAPPGWTWDSEPARLMGEPLLARSLGNMEGLTQKDRQGFLLAIRFRPERPFPLVPLFCFARLLELEGEWYAVFAFRNGGCPRLE